MWAPSSQSDQTLELFLKGNIGKTERWGGARMGLPERIDTILNWTGLVSKLRVLILSSGAISVRWCFIFLLAMMFVSCVWPVHGGIGCHLSATPHCWLTSSYFSEPIDASRFRGNDAEILIWKKKKLRWIIFWFFEGSFVSCNNDFLRTIREGRFERDRSNTSRGEEGEGDGMGPRRTPGVGTKYPDSHQLFVGNLPHNISERELKVFFDSKYNRWRVFYIAGVLEWLLICWKVLGLTILTYHWRRKKSGQFFF